MNPLGHCLFQERPNLRTTRSVSSTKIQQPVPGYPLLGTNLMARVWNAIPELQKTSSLASAKSISRKWARSVPR